MITDQAVDTNRYWTMTIKPTSYPVTVDEIKEFARIDGDDEDDILETFLESVINGVETYLGRSLITRTYKMIMDNWQEREIELPMPPLISVTSVTTVDEDDTATTYASTNYFVVTESIPGRLVIKKDSTLPTNTERNYAGYTITWTAGYGKANDVPTQLKTAIKQWVTMIYENRSMTDNEILHNEPPPDVKQILRPYRVLRI